MTPKPAGAVPVWMKRLANIGFGIAATYCAYLVVILVMAGQRNAEFSGKPFGSHQLERVSEKGALEGVEFSGLIGQKSAIVLWATWCGPCHSLLQDLKGVVADGKLDASRVFAVSVAEPLSDVSAFLETEPLPFSVLLDRQGVLAQAVRLSGTPTIVLIGSDGTIDTVSTGGFRLSSKIQNFLAQP